MEYDDVWNVEFLLREEISELKEDIEKLKSSKLILVAIQNGIPRVVMSIESMEAGLEWIEKHKREYDIEDGDDITIWEDDGNRPIHVHGYDENGVLIEEEF